MEWLVINLAAMGWMLFNARGRGVKNLYLLAGLTVFFGAWLIPHYIAIRPLFKGERREGGYWWNFFKNFILIWTLICVVWWIAGMGITSQAINHSSDKWERAGAGLGAAIGTGMIFFCWIAASMVSVVLGFLLKNSKIEEGDIDRATAQKSVKEIAQEAGNAIERVNTEIQSKSSEFSNRTSLIACVNRKCSARLPVGAKFCKECGASQTAVKSGDELKTVEILSEAKPVASPAVVQKAKVSNTSASPASVNRAEATTIRNKQAVPSSTPLPQKSSKRTVWIITAICLFSGLGLAGVGYWGWQQKIRAEEQAQALLLQKEAEQQRKEAEEKRLAEEQQRLQQEATAKQAEQEAADNAAQEDQADKELSARNEQVKPITHNEVQSQAERVRPGFDCTKAAKNYEILICRSDELARLDNELTQAYARRMNETRDEVAQYALREQQRGWLRDSRNLCANESCLKGAYISRINRLQQPNQ